MESTFDQLTRIAGNLWWSWQHDVVEIFRDLDSDLWRESDHNPVALLKRLGRDAVESRAAHLAIESRVIYAAHRLREYLLPEQKWGAAHAGPLNVRPVGYFSAEFGLHESIPIYSGGLGVLAGDHLKAASDLGLPIVGVGLFYDQGYFHQQIDSSGWQQESYGRSDLEMLPLERATEPGGEPLTVRVDTRTGPLFAGVLTLKVGRSLLVLLDPRIEANVEWDRQLTGHLERLYGGDERIRIRQELLLGIGGLRALRALGIDPGVLHLNEGHSAFALLEAARHVMEEEGMTFREALAEVGARTVFTTHTPVESGHDRFAESLVEEHIGPLRDALGIDAGELMALGKSRPEDPGEPFCMTALALRMARRANGVSFIHGQVSRRMWSCLWPRRGENEVPIGHITNGVHVESWLAPQMRRLYERHLGRDWTERIRRREIWQAMAAVDDGELWETHRFMKGRLIEFVRGRLVDQAKPRGDSEADALERASQLDPDALTIGFARRFAPYKRAWLLLDDEAWLERLLCDPLRKVQIIYAGKAHPRNDDGKRLLQRIFRLARDPRFVGRIVLVEDYDMNVGRNLVQGVDLWLNTPRRPLEACGTSGQKVVLNGGLNCSTLDGWWAEAFDGTNGFAIGSGRIHKTIDEQDRRDRIDLRAVLENEVIPMYYRRDESGLPREWIARMKRALVSLAWRFNASRMVVDYARLCYLPAAGAVSSNASDGTDRQTASGEE